MKSKRRVLQSIQRASDILDVFAQESRPLGLADMVKKMDLPKSTVQGLLYSLEALEYLEQDSQTHKYRLGPKLFHLGMKYIATNDIFAAAMVWMERLSYKHNQTVNIGMLIDGKVVVIMQVEPGNKSISYPKVGTILPIHSSSLGKALMATMNHSQRMEILENYRFSQYTDHTIGNMSDFLAELDSVGETGIAFDNQETAKGIVCIGAGVYNQKGQVVIAFSVTGKEEKILADKEIIIDSVRETSQQLSRQLGYIESVL